MRTAKNSKILTSEENQEKVIAAINAAKPEGAPEYKVKLDTVKDAFCVYYDAMVIKHNQYYIFGAKTTSPRQIAEIYGCGTELLKSRLKKTRYELLTLFKKYNFFWEKIAHKKQERWDCIFRRYQLNFLKAVFNCSEELGDFIYKDLMTANEKDFFINVCP